ncbi:MAG: hypothetical protein EZS28_018563 [Streblomastix strix]|uniref:Protein kinase domain-containing protein n=1 Tax=Streblomastix strix TaxID=222440 RepID=A0A5J4VTZ7_9EUKA|nr:MAG: hypothetical protein EZS28_018563 [Streblomastix strix]
MEGEDFGARCSFETCNKLDFLPIKCSSCKKQFCDKHFHPEAHFCKKKVSDSLDDIQSLDSQQSSYVDYEEILRQSEFVPIRPLGQGAFGMVYEAYDRENGIVAVKIIKKDKFDFRELEAAEIIHKVVQDCPYIMDHLQQRPNKDFQILIEEYSNMIYGMRVFHETGLVHRDIKCDNILLDCPLRSGCVYAKISDFGFAKKVDLIHEQTYFAGTLPYMSPEQFHENALITQKVDIYALGITFYNIIAHKYPVNERSIKEQGKKFAKLKSINRPPEIKDDILWDLLSRMLEFDPNKRISASEALKHPYFTSLEAFLDISSEQKKIAEKQKIKTMLFKLELFILQYKYF